MNQFENMMLSEGFHPFKMEDVQIFVPWGKQR